MRVTPPPSPILVTLDANFHLEAHDIPQDIAAVCSPEGLASYRVRDTMECRLVLIAAYLPTQT